MLPAVAVVVVVADIIVVYAEILNQQINDFICWKQLQYNTAQNKVVATERTEDGINS